MKTILTLTCLAVFGASLAATGRADERDDRIKALEQQLKAQDERIRRLEELLSGQRGKEAPPPKSLTIDPAGVTVQSEAKAAAPTNAPAPPLLSIGENGFVMQSGDTNFWLKIGGLLQIDARTYFDDGGITGNDMFLIRRARIALDGTVFRDFDFRLQPEFGGAGAPSLRDAYLNYRYAQEFQVRLGKFKTPVGLEQLRSDSATLFIERSLVSDLIPGRDVGLQLFGKALGGGVEYAVGLFNGVGDGSTSSNVDTDGEKSFAGRLFLYPWQRTSLKPLQKLGLGVGGSFARTDGAAALPSGNGFLTEGQQRFFSYFTSSSAGQPNVVGAGDHWRISPQASWYWGRWSALAEYVMSSQALRRSDLGVQGTMQNSAWEVALGCVLTGEDASPERVVPRRPFQPRRNCWGAVEVVLRCSSLDVDNHAFPLFADPTMSASQAMAWVVGLNWYLNKNVRASMDFFHTSFDGGQDGAVSGQDELALFGRLQLAF
jgi:phosphate-selective porin OprO and OprP